MRARLAEEWAAFLLALQFLTRLPFPVDAPYAPAAMAASPRWYPAVGALVGALSGAAFWLAALALPPTLAALLATAAGILVTGALHEDGLADACDGLGGGADRERALAIMRDSRLGAFGAIGLGIVLAAKVLALGAMPAAAPLMLVAGHAASRASMVLVMATGRYVRPEGAGSPVSGGIAAGGFALALATGGAAVALVAAAFSAPAAVGGLAGLAAGHAGMRLWFGRRLGGYTGDCLGAVQQTSEAGLYLGALACL